MPATDPCATFEHKWTTAHPEFGLALRFVPAPQRKARSALTCIGYEIEHAAFRLHEPQVAAGKLQWWLEELLAMRAGTARHPLTQALATTLPVANVPSALYQDLIVGALAQRDPEPAPSLDELLHGLLGFYAPLARVEQSLTVEGDVDTEARIGALSRAFRDALGLSDTLAGGRLPLPLDLMAHHRLSRVDLASPSAPRTEALRGYFAMLAERMEAIDIASLSSVPAATSWHAERVRCRRAARAFEPLAAGEAAINRLPVSTVWAAWRAARRQRARARGGSSYS